MKATPVHAREFDINEDIVLERLPAAHDGKDGTVQQVVSEEQVVRNVVAHLSGVVHGDPPRKGGPGVDVEFKLAAFGLFPGRRAIAALAMIGTRLQVYSGDVKLCCRCGQSQVLCLGTP